MTKFVGLRANTYSYLIDGGSEDKKAKGKKKCVMKRKLKFENYKNCLEATQLENKINYLEKNEIHIDSIKEFIKNNKSKIIKNTAKVEIWKEHCFTEEINKIALSSNDDKRMQSIYSIETYAHGMTYDLSGFKSRVNRHLLPVGSF